MPARLDPATAETMMRAAGVEPLEPYTNVMTPWRARCSRCGKTVTPTLSNVKSGHAACGYCAGKLVDPQDAIALMRSAGLEPLVDYPGAARPWMSCCLACGKEVSPRYANVAGGSAGCRYCARQDAGERSRLDAEEAAALMRQAGLTPLEDYPGSNTPWLCRCDRCGSEARPRYSDVRQGSGGCRRCGAAATAAALRLDSDYAAQFMIGKGCEPIDPYPGAGAPWRCRCVTCGDVVAPRYTNIRQGWGGCARCRGRESSLRQRGDEAAAVADMQARGLEPLEPYTSVMTPWRSQCTVCGAESSPLLNNIRRGHGGCGRCAGNRPDPDAAVTRMKAAGLNPLIPYPGRHRPWLSRCETCGRTVSPRYGAVARGGGCRFCRDTAIKPEVAVAAMRGAGVEPLEDYPGSVTPWRCRCAKCGRTVTPCYGTVQQGNGGCRWCRNSGFKAAEGAVVYLISHPGMHAVKVGITDRSGARLGRHQRRGWQVLVEERVPGERALEIEDDILTWWRSELDLPPYLTSAEMPQGGWTETVDTEGIDLAATIRRIKQTARAEADGTDLPSD